MSIYGLRSIAIGVLAPLVLGLILTWAAGSAMTRGRASIVPPAVAPARDLVLTASDGVRLAATYRPGARPDAPGVLLLHGVGASRASMAGNAEWLAAHGFATLAIDFRGHGGSAPTGRSFGLREAADARAAFDWLKNRQRGSPVAVVGVSMGGAASLIGPDGPLSADALVLQAVYPDIRRAIRGRIADRLGPAPARLLEPMLSLQSLPRFGAWPSDLSPLRAVVRYHGPLLVIGGMQDRYTPTEETRALYGAAPGPKRLWLVPRGGHAAISGLDTAEYRERLLLFLTGAIGRAR